MSQSIGCILSIVEVGYSKLNALYICLDNKYFILFLRSVCVNSFAPQKLLSPPSSTS